MDWVQDYQICDEPQLSKVFRYSKTESSTTVLRVKTGNKVSRGSAVDYLHRMLKQFYAGAIDIDVVQWERLGRMVQGGEKALRSAMTRTYINAYSGPPKA